MHNLSSTDNSSNITKILGLNVNKIEYFIILCILFITFQNGREAYENQQFILN